MMAIDDGTAKALEALDKEIKRIKGASAAAFWEAGLIIIGASMDKVPVVLGNLRGSAYVRNKSQVDRKGASDSGDVPTGKLPDIGVEVGYYASYAASVHESMETMKGVDRVGDGAAGNGTYWDNGQPKFLESVVMSNLDLIPEIVRKRTEMDKERRI